METRNHNFLVSSCSSLKALVSIAPQSVLEHSKFQVKSQHRLSRQWSTSFQFGICNKNKTDDTQQDSLSVNLEAESEFKYKLSPSNNHVNLYFSVRHCMDGWRYMFGFKVVGIKIKLPLNIVMSNNSVTTESY
jgi:hypothetical protein